MGSSAQKQLQDIGFVYVTACLSPKGRRCVKGQIAELGSPTQTACAEERYQGMATRSLK